MGGLVVRELDDFLDGEGRVVDHVVIRQHPTRDSPDRAKDADVEDRGTAGRDFEVEEVFLVQYRGEPEHGDDCAGYQAYKASDLYGFILGKLVDVAVRGRGRTCLCVGGIGGPVR